MYNGSVKVHVHVVSSFCSCLLVMTRFTKNLGIRMECGEEFNGIRNQLLPYLVPSESSYLYVRPGFTVYYRACSFVELMTKNLSAKIDLLGYRWVRDQVAFCSVTLITHTSIQIVVEPLQLNEQFYIERNRAVYWANSFL